MALSLQRQLDGWPLQDLRVCHYSPSMAIAHSYHYGIRPSGRACSVALVVSAWLVWESVESMVRGKPSGCQPLGVGSVAGRTGYLG